jgi:hypothetical protein
LENNGTIHGEFFDIFQILVFLSYLGSNSFYHVVRDCRGPSTTTVHQVVHQVGEELARLKKDFISWPASRAEILQMSEKFQDLAGILFNFLLGHKQCYIKSPTHKLVHQTFVEPNTRQPILLHKCLSTQKIINFSKKTISTPIRNIYGHLV